MHTLSHPKAPTVQYQGDICVAVIQYALDHLSGYHVHAVEDAASNHGIGFEVIDLETSETAGLICIH